MITYQAEPMFNPNSNCDLARRRITYRHARLLQELKRMDKDAETLIRNLQKIPSIQPIDVRGESPLGYMIRARSIDRRVTVELSLDVHSLAYSIHLYRHAEDGDIIGYQAFISLAAVLNRLKRIL